MIADGRLADMVTTATTWIIPVIFAVTFHEAAHGIAAYQLGDDTAMRAGRVCAQSGSTTIDPLWYDPAA